MDTLSQELLQMCKGHLCWECPFDAGGVMDCIGFKKYGKYLIEEATERLKEVTDAKEDNEQTKRLLNMRVIINAGCGKPGGCHLSGEECKALVRWIDELILYLMNKGGGRNDQFCG